MLENILILQNFHLFLRTKLHDNSCAYRALLNKKKGKKEQKRKRPERKFTKS